MASVIEYAFYVLVAFIVLYILISVLKIFYRLFYPFFIGRPIDLRRRAGGKWAVITGSTDGIGKEYERQLAERGFNILLIARNPGKLEATQRELASDFKVEIRTHKVDFSEARLEDYETLKKMLDYLEVGVLVNNVGAGFEIPADLPEQPLDNLLTITIVNTQPETLLSAIVLRQMRARGTGIIIDISSASALYPMTMWNAYSASKKYHQWLSDIVRRENSSHKGIIIQTVTPAVVATNMSGNPKTSFTQPTPKTFVRSAIRTVGLIDTTSGYIGHQLQVEFWHLLPSFIFFPLSKRFSQKVQEQLTAKLVKKDGV